MTRAGTRTDFAGQLLQWRLRCRVGQLDLAIRAGTTQRYLSFLEQGRSRPGRAMVVRLAESLGMRNRADRRPDPVAEDLIAELESYLPPPDLGPGHLGFAVPLRLRGAAGELRLITMISTFATAVDVTLAELHLEAFLPADEVTARILRERADK